MNRAIALPAIVLVLVIGAGIWFLTSKGEPDIKDFELDKDKQQFIWDSEHVTFEIENYFGKPFADAIRKAEDSELRKLAADEFVAAVNVKSAPDDRPTPGFQTTSYVATEGESTDLDGFIQFFRTALQPFEKIERTKTRVLKIKSKSDPQSIWETELLFTAHGINADGRPIKLRSYHVATFDYDEDEVIQNGGALKTWQLKKYSVSVSDKPLMTEATTEFQLNSIQLPDNWKMQVTEARQFLFQIAVEDFDKDGDVDIAVATYDGIPFLLCNEEGRFVERSKAYGLKSWQPSGPTKSALAGWIDFDNDSYPDLVLGQKIYKNIGGLRFQDISETSGFSAGFDPLGMTVADYNNDGLLDIYLSRSHSHGQVVDRAGWVGDEEAGAPNSLWKNSGDGKFVEVTEQANAGGGNRTTFTSSWFYYDDDVYPDLYLANDFASNVVLRNKGDGTFEDVSQPSGAADFATSMGVATGDLDNDGTTEIYVANMYSKMGRRIISHVSAADYPEGIYPQIQGSCAGNRLYRKSSDGVYKDVTDIAGVNEVGWAFSPLLCDFDGDGLLDIYASTGFMSFDRQKPDG